MQGWRKICCAIDFSTTSEEALHAAAALAKKLDAKLVLIHVQSPEMAEHGAVAALYSQPEVREQLARAEKLLLVDWQRRAADQVGGEVDVATSVSPHIAERINELAEREGCDLLVLGTHGRQGARRALLGSVAEKVVRTAPCPVLTVRRPAKVLRTTTLG